VKTFDEISRLPEFENDLKRLHKRFKTLEDDLKIFIEKELYLYHKLKIYKAKKFACRSLRGKGVQSGIRIIYLYNEESDQVELIEIYYKSDKNIEDRIRIFKYYRE
jgi:mRNA-degrading endonuclease RelE of RelBE toxin-antitoxin system